MNEIKRRRTTELRTGDIVKAKRPEDSQNHVWIIMQTSLTANKDCVRAFNLTSSPAPEGEKMIKVANKDIPNNWFDLKKPQTFVRINDEDCLLLSDVTDRLGTAKEICPRLLEEVCKKTYSCDVAPDLRKLCDCDYGLMDRKIALEIEAPPPCDCEKAVFHY